MDSILYAALSVIYSNLHYAGVQMLRLFLRIKRYTRTVFLKIKGRMIAFGEISRKKQALWFKIKYEQLKKPFVKLKNGISVHKNEYLAKKNINPNAKYIYCLNCIWLIIKYICKILFWMFNWVIPLVSIGILALTINYFNSLNIALSVEYAGEHMGYIENEAIFEQADQKMQERIIFAGEEIVRPTDAIARFSVTVVGDEQMTEVSELADRLIEVSGNQIEPAYGFYVNNEFLGATKDRDYLLLALDELKKENIPEEADLDKTSIEFVDTIEVTKQGLYPTASVVTGEKLKELINSQAQVERTYTVVSGDTPTGIAQKVGIRYSILKSLNPGIEERLMPGDDVIIQGMQKFLPTKVVEIITYEEEIPYKNIQTTSTKYSIGYTKITKVGKNGLREITAKVTKIGGVEDEREIIGTKVITEVVNQEILVGGTKPLTNIPPVSSGSGTPGTFIRPVRGGSISMPIWGYYGHTGNDYAGIGYGSPIYAAQAGRVVKSQSLVYGYGKHIIIDHGGGLRTLYAHNSVLRVRVGDYVAQGQVIASAGSTGRSTGTHLHFEIISNGKYLDSRNYF